MTEGKDENAPADSYDYKRLHSYPLIRVSIVFLFFMNYRVCSKNQPFRLRCLFQKVDTEL